MTPGKLRIPPTTPNDFIFEKEILHNSNILSENITKRSSRNNSAKNNEIAENNN